MCILNNLAYEIVWRSDQLVILHLSWVIVRSGVLKWNQQMLALNFTLHMGSCVGIWTTVSWKDLEVVFSGSRRTFILQVWWLCEQKGDHPLPLTAYQGTGSLPRSSCEHSVGRWLSWNQGKIIAPYILVLLGLLHWTFQSPIHVASPVHGGWLVCLVSLSKVKHIMNLILSYKGKHLSFHIGCGVSQQYWALLVENFKEPKWISKILNIRRQPIFPHPPD